MQVGRSAPRKWLHSQSQEQGSNQGVHNDSLQASPDLRTDASPTNIWTPAVARAAARPDKNAHRRHASILRGRHRQALGSDTLVR